MQRHKHALPFTVWKPELSGSYFDPCGETRPLSLSSLGSLANLVTVNLFLVWRRRKKWEENRNFYQGVLFGATIPVRKYGWKGISKKTTTLRFSSTVMTRILQTAVQARLSDFVIIRFNRPVHFFRRRSGYNFYTIH